MFYRVLTLFAPLIKRNPKGDMSLVKM